MLAAVFLLCLLEIYLSDETATMKINWLACFFLCAYLCPTASAQRASPAYKNSKLPIAQRVDDLVSRMTLEEKVSQLGHTGGTKACTEWRAQVKQPYSRKQSAWRPLSTSL
jgi:beta-glucosidase